jgi:hypothetical protein
VNWDLRFEPPPPGGGGGGEEGGSANALPRPPRPITDRGPFVAPGSFVVTLDVDGARQTQLLTVRPDPLLPVTVAQHRQREAFLTQVLDAQRTTTDMGTRMTSLRQLITERRDAAGQGTAARTAGDSALARLTALERRVRQGQGALRGRVYNLAGEYNGNGAQQGSLYPPTRTHRDAFAAMLVEIARVQRELAALEVQVRTVQ